MAKLNAYLMFNGDCKEAMEFYKSCFGGKLDVMTISQSPMAAQYAADVQDKVMHAYLESGNSVLMASDTFQGRVKHGDSIHLVLVGDTMQETEMLFSKLSAGGIITRPLKAEFFGTYGELTDKYGFLWMFQFGTGQMK